MKEKRFPWNRVVIGCAVAAVAVVWLYMGMPFDVLMVIVLVWTGLLAGILFGLIRIRFMSREELFEASKELFMSGTACGEEDLDATAKRLGVAREAIRECWWVPCTVKWDVGSSAQLYVCSTSELLSKSRTRDDRGFVALVERDDVKLAIFSPNMTNVAWLRGGREPVRDVIRKAMEEGWSLTESAERQGWEW